MQINKFVRKKVFENVPPGSDKLHTYVLDFAVNLPQVKIVQKKGQRACFPYSFTNALHHIGAKQVASEVDQSNECISDKFNMFVLFIQSLGYLNH